MRYIFLILLLFPIIANAAIYEIGQGHEYETLRDLQRNVVLLPGDIVDGGGNIFQESWRLNSSGDGSGNITIRNAIIDVTNLNSSGFVTDGADYLILEKLKIFGSSKSGILLKSSNIIIDYCEITACMRGISSTVAGYVEFRNWTIRNSKIHDNIEFGIWWNSGDPENDIGLIRDIVISENEIYSNQLSGIKINSTNRSGGDNHSTANISVINNRVYSNGWYGVALQDISGHSLVSKNEIFNNGTAGNGINANGLWFGYASNVVIEFNNVYGNKTGRIDGIGIFLDHDVSNCIVRYNETHGHLSCSDQKPWGPVGSLNSSGIGLCCGAHHNEIYSNVVYRNIFGIGVSSDAYENQFKNNRVYSNVIDFWQGD